MSYFKTSRFTSFLSESDSGRPTPLSPTNTNVLLHETAHRNERVWIYVSNLDPVARDVLVFVGGETNDDVLRLKVPAHSTISAIPHGGSLVLGRHQRIWALTTAGNVNVIGRIEAA